VITRADLNARVSEWQLADHVIEKDYVLGWLLWGIGQHARLSVLWAFKGGTCLKKCFVETFRFSEDLDFTVLPGGPFRAEEVTPLLLEVLDLVGQESGLDFAVRPPEIRLRPDGRSSEGRIFYRGPRGAPSAASVKLDLSASEVVVRPTVLREIGHEYPDRWRTGATVRCYGFEEVFAEKLRALGERCRPRDLYDVIHLYRRPDLHGHAELVRAVLNDKCASKSVAVPTLASVTTEEHRSELQGEWEHMLGHQLQALPPFGSFWDELPLLFDWLNGAAAPLIPAMAAAKNEDTTWRPPALVTSWGQGSPLEVVRFAAANHLCLDLDYAGEVRRIEPYSLRRTLDGNLILHAVRRQDGQSRSYRVDRIAGARVTTEVFQPRYQIEFSASGALQTPPTPRRAGPVHGRGHARYHGPVWVVQCPMCHRSFSRRTPDWSLRRHKTMGGWPCPGTHGWLVGTRFV
jgi:predicted nucleotidyltransferase component of viral defense system